MPESSGTASPSSPTSSPETPNSGHNRNHQTPREYPETPAGSGRARHATRFVEPGLNRPGGDRPGKPREHTPRTRRCVPLGRSKSAFGRRRVLSDLSLLASLPVAGRAQGLYGSREPALGANVFRLDQTAPDCLRVLLQVGGSPFDCAGRGSTDRMRMACKRPGVRVPLAPLSDVSAGQRPVRHAGPLSLPDPIIWAPPSVSHSSPRSMEHTRAAVTSCVPCKRRGCGLARSPARNWRMHTASSDHEVFAVNPEAAHVHMFELN